MTSASLTSVCCFKAQLSGFRLRRADSFLSLIGLNRARLMGVTTGFHMTEARTWKKKSSWSTFNSKVMFLLVLRGFPYRDVHHINIICCSIPLEVNTSLSLQWSSWGPLRAFLWMVSTSELLRDKFCIQQWVCNAGFNIKVLNHWGKKKQTCRLGKWIEMALRRCCSGASSKALNFCCLSGSAQWPTLEQRAPPTHSLLCDLKCRAPVLC